MVRDEEHDRERGKLMGVGVEKVAGADNWETEMNFFLNDILAPYFESFTHHRVLVTLNN